MQILNSVFRNGSERLFLAIASGCNRWQLRKCREDGQDRDECFQVAASCDVTIKKKSFMELFHGCIETIVSILLGRDEDSRGGVAKRLFNLLINSLRQKSR